MDFMLHCYTQALDIEQIEMKINKPKNLYFCVARRKHFDAIMTALMLFFFSCYNLFSFWYILGKDVLFGAFPKENYSLENSSATFTKVSLR